jgi:outer membrane protein assembly factor BamB
MTVAALGATGALAAGVGVYVITDEPRDASLHTVQGETPPTTAPPAEPREVPVAIIPPTTTTLAVGARPSDFVGVTADGRLVVVDVATGTEVRELTRRADPRQSSEPEGGPSVIAGVTVDRERGIVYFETCCEPAVGSVYSVPLTGGAITPVSNFSWPALSADGDTLVGLGGDLVVARENLTSRVRIARDEQVAVFHTAISPDGSRLAYERAYAGPNGNSSELVVVAADDIPADATDEEQRTALDDAVAWRDPDQVGWMFPAINREGNVVVAQQCCYGLEPREGPRSARVIDPDTGQVVGSFQYPAPVVDQEYDATGTWLVVTLADGRVVWFGGGESGELASGYLAADW